MSCPVVVHSTPARPTSPSDVVRAHTSRTSVVHTQYDVESPPSKPPEGNWVRFVCISDTHENVFPIPMGDVLLHGGDLTHTGRLNGVRNVVNWLSKLPHPHKIVVAGNHDLTLHADWYEDNFSRWHLNGREDTAQVKSLLTNKDAKRANITYLQDAKCEFRALPGGKVWSVYGSPWQPEFYNWAFNYKRGEQADAIVSKYEKTDILITHGPPYGILDETARGMHVGCEALLARLPQLRPRLHVFGHIHEAHGVEVQKWEGQDGEDVTETVFVNGANWPMGEKIAIGQKFGEGPFMPVIVDLLES